VDHHKNFRVLWIESGIPCQEALCRRAMMYSSMLCLSARNPSQLHAEKQNFTLEDMARVLLINSKQQIPCFMDLAKIHNSSLPLALQSILNYSAISFSLTSRRFL
jgi:hypothetical protein